MLFAKSERKSMKPFSLVKSKLIFRGSVLGLKEQFRDKIAL